MRLLNSFFGVLLITLLAACSSSTSTNATYPYQVGTFSVTSKSQAQWTGQRGQFNQRGVAIGDTTRFVNPDSLSMTVQANPDNQTFYIFVNDSTISPARLDSLKPSKDDYHIYNATGIDLHDASLRRHMGTIAVTFNGIYDCSAVDTTTGSESFTYNMYLEHHRPPLPDYTTLYRRYELKVDGIQQTLEHLACGKPAPN